MCGIGLKANIFSYYTVNEPHAYLWFVFGTVLMMSGAPICSRTICATEANYPVYTYTSIIPHQKLIYITVIYYTRSHTSQMCGDKVYYTILHMTPINKMSLTQSYHRRKWERSALLNMTQLVVGSWHSVSGYANVA